MFVEYIYIYIWTVQPRNGTPKHSEIEIFHSNWKNETLTETKLTILIKIYENIKKYQFKIKK